MPYSEGEKQQVNQEILDLAKELGLKIVYVKFKK